MTGPRFPLYSLILAAGKGRRMRSESLHKVCFEIDGVPAIHRALDVYNRLGVTRNVIVVGELAGQVVELVGRRYPNVVFAYQPEARGTGDAVRCGLPALAEAAPDARILLVAGDKLLEGQVLERLLARCAQADADLGLVVSPATWGGESAGRVLTDSSGRPLAIVEAADIRLRQCREALRQLAVGRPGGALTRAEVLEVVSQWLGVKGRLEKVLPREIEERREGGYDTATLARALGESPRDFDWPERGTRLSPEEAWAADWRNEFVYLVTPRALAYGLQHMTTQNAQGESYLTDAIGAICTAVDERGEPRYRVVVEPTLRTSEVLSYNDPEELLQIEDHLRGRRRESESTLRQELGEGRFKRVTEWQRLFPEAGPPPAEALRVLEGFYGEDPEVLSERAGALSRVLGEFARQFGGEREVVLVRSPGRINLMGRHIDWQGGRCNLMAVTQEVVMVAGPRNDDRIEARNVAPDQFPDARITLGEMVSRLAWDDWMSVVDSGELHRHLREQEGHWRLYIEAAMLRLQMAFRTRALQGMDLAVLGNIPPAAGMSSSSALVVATAEAAVSLNNLDVSPQQFVNFCGEGEWFVGTRGGSADHAAMKLGRKGTVNHVEFHDFRLIERLELPSTHKLVVANSLVLAKKAVGARATFNARVGSYLVGLELIRARFPRQAPFIRLIRDLNPEALGLNASWIYQVLLELPLAVTARWVRERFQGDGEAWPRLAPHFAQAAGDNEYPVRGVVMFGVAECARSRQAAELLRQGDLPGVGELMRISHDGERCFITRGPGPAQPFAVDISDAALRQLVEDLASGDPVRQTNARLERQPGAYRASTEEVDTLVDLANAVPGVLGAQIAGAGLGGCAMILAENDAVSALCDRLHREYYDARGLPRSVLVCRASAGSGLIDIPSPKTTSD